ncbi:hypothetical protein BT69DRAFT_1347260 [Atractiella rhizophila]|nr:hypothetical protein BT69DRAFT_1347260 [Atractiella rhizophila]
MDTTNSYSTLQNQHIDLVVVRAAELDNVFQRSGPIRHIHEVPGGCLLILDNGHFVISFEELQLLLSQPAISNILPPDSGLRKAVEQNVQAKRLQEFPQIPAGGFASALDAVSSSGPIWDSPASSGGENPLLGFFDNEALQDQIAQLHQWDASTSLNQWDNQSNPVSEFAFLSDGQYSDASSITPASTSSPDGSNSNSSNAGSRPRFTHRSSSSSSRKAKNRYVKDREPYTIQLASEDLTFAFNTSNCFPVAPGTPGAVQADGHLEKVTLKAGKYYRVWKREDDDGRPNQRGDLVEKFPWTSNGNDFLYGQSQGFGTCLDGFSFVGHGAQAFKRPVMIRDVQVVTTIVDSNIYANFMYDAVVNNQKTIQGKNNNTGRMPSVVSRKAKNRYVKDREPYTIQLASEDLTFAFNTSNCFPVAPGTPGAVQADGHLEKVTLKAGKYYRVWKREDEDGRPNQRGALVEKFPWTSNGNDFLYGQSQGFGTCLDGFSFVGHGAQPFKRPVMIRDVQVVTKIVDSNIYANFMYDAVVNRKE